jgi:hypothetical protein
VTTFCFINSPGSSQGTSGNLRRDFNPLGFDVRRDSWPTTDAQSSVPQQQFFSIAVEAQAHHPPVLHRNS